MGKLYAKPIDLKKKCALTNIASLVDFMQNK